MRGYSEKKLRDLLNEKISKKNILEKEAKELRHRQYMGEITSIIDERLVLIRREIKELSSTIDYVTKQLTLLEQAKNEYKKHFNNALNALKEEY